MAFIRLRKFPLFSPQFLDCWEFFWMNVGIYEMLFLYLLYLLRWFFSLGFFLCVAKYWITVTDFQTLNDFWDKSYIGHNVLPFLYTAWLSLLIYSWGFLHLCLLGRLVYNFYFLYYLSQVLVSEWCWAHKVIGNCSPSSVFWRYMCRFGILCMHDKILQDNQFSPREVFW